VIYVELGDKEWSVRSDRDEGHVIATGYTRTAAILAGICQLQDDMRELCAIRIDMAFTESELIALTPLIDQVNMKKAV
jgi:hypothetical protein